VQQAKHCPGSGRSALKNKKVVRGEWARAGRLQIRGSTKLPSKRKKDHFVLFCEGGRGHYSEEGKGHLERVISYKENGQVSVLELLHFIDVNEKGTGQKQASEGQGLEVGERDYNGERTWEKSDLKSSEGGIGRNERLYEIKGGRGPALKKKAKKEGPSESS